MTRWPRTTQFSRPKENLSKISSYDSLHHGCGSWKLSKFQRQADGCDFWSWRILRITNILEYPVVGQDVLKYDLVTRSSLLNQKWPYFVRSNFISCYFSSNFGIRKNLYVWNDKLMLIKISQYKFFLLGAVGRHLRILEPIF